jgi:2-C-methyl-D-erythritol 4-phosphate cytidylyltransferase
MNIYAGILAGGKGTRMNNATLPKQFLEIGNKPVIIHTVEKFLLHEKISSILIIVPEQWVTYTEDLVNKYIGESSHIHILCGGDTRNETIFNGIKFIDSEFGLNDEDVFITHDAVRPFITYKIIEDNIKNVIEFGATDTVISATDTIVRSLDNKIIEDIPNRKFMYQGQTPQSFNIKVLSDCYGKLSDEEKEELTDACKIVLKNNLPVKLVEGSEFNIKLTTPFDLIMADSILNYKGDVNA